MSYIGKLIWAKGSEKGLELQEKYKAETKSYFSMDVYGSGQDEAAIPKALSGHRHASSRAPGFSEHVNKRSVVHSVSREALAMGKFVVLPEHRKYDKTSLL